MVRIFFTCLFICATSLAQAVGGCIKATQSDPRLCPAELAVVRSVRVEKQGQLGKAPPEPLVDCRRFVLTPALVRRYFARAMRVEDNRGEHAVDRGPCEVVGTLR